MNAAHPSKDQHEQFLKAYEEYADPIFRFCIIKVRNREVAKDLVQDTFTKTWEYIASGGTVDTMRAFLYRVARNLIVDFVRKKKTSSLDEMLEEGNDFGVDPRERNTDQLDGKQAVLMLDALGKKYRDVLILHFIEELSIPEIAAILDESENTISVRIHRGLKQAREIMEKKSEA